MNEIERQASHPVLVVEDDIFLREMMVDILAEAGYATYEAGCAAEALGLLHDRPQLAAEIALVITDIDMPGDLDGIGLAQHLRESFPQIGVIITSGAHRGAALAVQPPLRFLPKPFRATGLVAAVQAVIKFNQEPAQVRVPLTVE